jgi:hypothetical protein
VSLGEQQLAVGAPSEDCIVPSSTSIGPPQILTGAGAAYVIAERAGVWKQEARVQASNADTNDLFGTGLALAGDWLAVGAPYEDSAAQGINGDQTNNASLESGAAYLYLREAQGFVQHAYVKPNDSQAGSIFGWSVSLRGTTLAVGAWTESRRDGSAYLFGTLHDRWSELTRFVATTARGSVADDSTSDTFGWALTLSSRALFVGAPYERPFVGESGIGTAYCFE